MANMASCYTVCPDDRVYSNSLKKYVTHNIDYLIDSIGYIPTEQAAWGQLINERDGVGQIFYQNFITQGALHLNNCVQTTDSSAIADYVAKWPAAIWNLPEKYTTASTMFLVTEVMGEWHATNNPYRTPSDYWGNQPYYFDAISSSSTTDLITVTTYDKGMAYANDDPIVFLSIKGNGVSANIPSGLTEGVTYYVRDHTTVGNGGTFSVAATPGGSVIQIGDASDVYFVGRPAIAATSPMTFPPYNYAEDESATISRSTLVLANKHDNTIVPDSLVVSADAWLTNRDYPNDPIWAYK
jgi:hypothetical protein